MSDQEHPNGGGAAEEVPAGEVITIVLTRQPWGVSVNAAATDPLACLAALRTAIDELEAQIRLQRVAQLQQQAAERVAANALVNKVLRETRH